MSIFGEESKRVYEGKKRYADDRMAKCAENTKLTFEQHNVLRWVCRIRHEIHSDPEVLFYDEAPDHERFWAAISDSTGETKGNIKNMVKSVGLPLISLDIPDYEYITDSTYQADGMTYEDGLRTALSTAETVNDIIEKYLHKIDEQYGTEYAPTGMSRDI